MVADDILAFCGTINFDFRSLAHHFECGVTMYNVSCIKDMVEDFKNMEKESEQVLKEPKLGLFSKILISIMRVFRTLF